MSTFNQDKGAALAEAQRQQNLIAYKNWVARRPEVRDCEANLKMFQSYMDFTDPLVDADFDFALGNLRSSLALQRIPTQEEIVAAENKHRKRLSLPELQQLARDENPAPTRTPLPNEFFGYDVSTAKALKTLAKNNVTAFRALCSRYGTDKVNERLGVAAPKQVGRSITLNI